MSAPRIDYAQPELRLEFPVHRNENNSASQKQLDAKRETFSKTCAKVYALLMKGERLTVRQCAIDGISSLPRRIKDLRENGVHISDEWREGVKHYHLTDADLSFNRWTFRDQEKAA